MLPSIEVVFSTGTGSLGEWEEGLRKTRQTRLGNRSKAQRHRQVDRPWAETGLRRKGCSRPLLV